MLYIVPTPIGNLDDMTYRGVQVLRTCDVILAEDTRTSKKLLQHYQIDKPLWAFHAFNEHKALKGILDNLHQGKTLALISDAGTPGISDPGFLLVRACIAENIKVSCLPGATAFVPALVASGMTSDKFYFEGFLPHKKGRQTRLKYLAQLSCTIILYESPYRLLKCLEEIREYLGNERNVCVAREISKVYEEFLVLDVSTAIQHYTNHPPKGEIVIVIEGTANTSSNPDKE
ncbi:MAG TPA: 16S rRNA (cytidine(1402)-2'-O)-methyltransferase [Saprospiraceae bacterium]|nr:16S rRNA (cytidine(1402)-2'-O)-methyltransferase [Saprospiraceae bacterium]HRO09536.1 16S rRNA (cytidine(1402)-2'-O)-methyltransferase [Saprospiraceae bacterium]HRO72290.1 16S rRNA (cytidine(1402)-2'-O)-methyltransferase [Saprospiraceae bacterium]HRP42815.1 16S rRNA (cytidine(1402)-2'-O)-methyltransferase [Saprospiraceae bacterium]